MGVFSAGYGLLLATPVTFLPTKNLTDLAKKSCGIVMGHEVLHDIVEKVYNSNSDAMYLVQHLQGMLQSVNVELLNRSAHQALEHVLSLKPLFSNIMVVFENDTQQTPNPNKLAAAKRTAEWKKAIKEERWIHAVRPTDCMVSLLQHLLTEHSIEWCKAAQEGEYEAIAIAAKRQGLVLTAANDSDLLAIPSSLGRAVFNYRVVDDRLVGSLNGSGIARENLATHAGAGCVGDWPSDKIVLATCAAGTDWWKCSTVGSVKAVQAVHSCYDPTQSLWKNAKLVEAHLEEKYAVQMKASPKTYCQGVAMFLHQPVFNEAGDGFCPLVPFDDDMPQECLDVFKHLPTEALTSEVQSALYCHSGDSLHYREHGGCNGAPAFPADPSHCPTEPADHLHNDMSLHDDAGAIDGAHTDMDWKLHLCILNGGCSEGPHCERIVTLAVGDVFSTSLGASSDVASAKVLVENIRVDVAARCRTQGYEVSCIRTRGINNVRTQGDHRILQMGCAQRPQSTAIGSKPANALKKTTTAEMFQQSTAITPMLTPAQLQHIHLLPRGGKALQTALSGRMQSTGMVAITAAITRTRLLEASPLAEAGGTPFLISEPNDDVALSAPGSPVYRFAHLDDDAQTRWFSDIRPFMQPGEPIADERAHLLWFSQTLPVQGDKDITIHQCTPRLSWDHSLVSSPAAISEDFVVITRRQALSGVSAIHNGTKLSTSFPWYGDAEADAVVTCQLFQKNICHVIVAGATRLGRGDGPWTRIVLTFAANEASAKQHIANASAARSIAVTNARRYSPWMLMPLFSQSRTRMSGDVSKIMKLREHARSCDPAAQLTLKLVPEFTISITTEGYGLNNISRRVVHTDEAGVRAAGLDKDTLLALAQDHLGTTSRVHCRKLQQLVKAAVDMPGSVSCGEFPPQIAGPGVLPQTTSVTVVGVPVTIVNVCHVDGRHTHGCTRSRAAPKPSTVSPLDDEWLSERIRSGQSVSSMLVQLHTKYGFDGDSKQIRNAARRIHSDALARLDQSLEAGDLHMLGSQGGKLLATALARETTVTIVHVEDQTDPGAILPAFHILKLPPASTGSPCRIYRFDASVARAVVKAGDFSVVKHILDGGTSDLPSCFRPWTLSGSHLHLLSFAEVTIPDLLAAARCPENVFLDGTCSTNAVGWQLFSLTCADAQSKNQNMCVALAPTESGESAHFILVTTLPLLYGRALLRTTAIITDQALGLGHGVDAALRSGFYCPSCKHCQCYWHGACLRYLKVYARLREGDAGTGDHVQAILRFVSQHASNPQEVDAGLQFAEEFVQKAFSLGVITTAQRHALISLYLMPIGFQRAKVFPGACPTLRTLAVVAGSRVEGENGAMKTTATFRASSNDSLAVCAGKHVDRQNVKHINSSFSKDRLLQLRPKTDDLSLEFKDLYVDWACWTTVQQIELARLGYTFAKLEDGDGLTVCYTCKPVRKPLPAANMPQFDNRTLITVHECPLGPRISCSRLFCNQLMLPCRHLLAFNDLRTGKGDCSARYLRRVYSGELDNKLYASGSYPTHNHRVPLRVDLTILHTGPGEVEQDPTEEHEPMEGGEDPLVAAAGWVTSAAISATAPPNARDLEQEVAVLKKEVYELFRLGLGGDTDVLDSLRSALRAIKIDTENIEGATGEYTSVTISLQERHGSSRKKNAYEMGHKEKRLKK